MTTWLQGYHHSADRSRSTLWCRHSDMLVILVVVLLWLDYQLVHLSFKGNFKQKVSKGFSFRTYYISKIPFFYTNSLNTTKLIEWEQLLTIIGKIGHDLGTQ